MFRNHQWGVQDWGLQSTPPGAPYKYDIIAIQLLNTLDDNDMESPYSWPFQMTTKLWIDFDAFMEAFKEAVKFHVIKCGPVDKNKLVLSELLARKDIKNMKDPNYTDTFTSWTK